jgi:YD repeat-containing protein
MTYDARYRPLTNVLSAGAATLSSHSYAYDAAGNILSITDALSAAYNRTFAYDDLGRLTTANSGTALWGSGSYAYDAMGNMLTSTLGSSSTTFTYQGTTPRLATVSGVGNVTYDAAGNETGGLRTLQYSPRNLLTTDGNQYDGCSVRVSRASTTLTDWTYTPELHPLMSYTQSYNGYSWDLVSARQFVWFGDLPVAQIDSIPDEFGLPSDTIRYTFTDHLGTPIVQTDDTATIVWRAEHDPYGHLRTLLIGNLEDQPLRLPGQEAFVIPSDKGVFEPTDYYNIFRWYRAGWGRYTQADPIGIGGRGISLFPSGERVMWTQRHFENLRSHGYSGASALTTYAYAEDTPVRAIDPLGLVIWNCLAKAITGMTTHRPNDPQDIKKGFKLVCVYEVECETVDLLSPYPIKIEGFWIRDMHTVRPCSCDKYCSFQVGGLPQTVMEQNLFVPLGPPYCSNLDSRNGI